MYYKPDFSNSIINSGNNDSFVGFNPSAVNADMDNSNNPTRARFKVDKLKTENSCTNNSLGLYFDNLISKDKDEKTSTTSINGNSFNNPENNAIIEESEMFKSLIKEDPKNTESAFAIQPLSSNMDRSMLPKPMSLADQVMANAHLNKDAANQKASGRKINNWFARLIEQRGEDYISSGRLSVDEVSKNADRIIDEMISGKIDYNIYGKYIIAPVVIETLISYCSNKLAINKAIQYALGYTYNDYSNRMYITDAERSLALSVIDDGLGRDIAQSITIVNQDILIYEILYKKLVYVNSTKNVSGLFGLINDLNNYKKQSKKRY